MSTQPTLAEPTAAFQKLRELTKGIRTAMVTTVADDGSLQSRPMATQETAEDGYIWFFTSDDSGKAHQLAREDHVNVAFADPSKDRYVSIAGIGTVVKDDAKAKELFNPWVKAYFPDGLDDPRLALLRVRIASAAYWEAKNSQMVQLIKMAAAAVTHHQADLGVHGKIDVPLRRP